MVTSVEFLSAAARGNLNKIKQGLDEHIDVNVKDSSGMNALHKSASRGQEAVAQILIANNVSLNAQDQDGNTPMHLAAEGGYVSFISLLMNAGADLFVKNVEQEIPLQVGIGYGHSDVGELFVKYKSLQKNQTILHLAAIKKDYQVLSYITTFTSGDEAININAVDSQGYNALHLAVEMNFEAGAIDLLNAGIDVNAKDNKGNTPLHIAMELLNPKPLVTLLDNGGADFTVKNDDGQISLHLASNRGHLDVLNILLSKSLDINSQDKRGRTPLYFATAKNFRDIVDLLIDKKADVRLYDIDGNTPLHIAALKDYSNLVIKLIKSNSDVDIRNNKAQTPLHLAALGGCVYVVPLLLAGNADINAKDGSKKTPFELAVKERDVVVDQSKKDNLEKVIEYLVKSKKALNQGTLLHSAVSENNVKLVRLLLKEKADVDTRDKNLKTPLHYSVSKGELTIVEEILKSGASVDAQDFKGDTPIYIASAFNNTRVVEELVKHNANVNLSNKNGRTALHQSSRKGYLGVTKILLNANADVNVQDEEYNTPLSEAQKGNYTMVAELLIQHGAKVDILSDGKAALHRAVEDGDETAVRQIIEQNGNINVQDHTGQTPLHYASYRGNKVMVNLLLDLGAIPDIEDNLGRTPFDLALESQLYTKSVLDLFIKYRDKENNTLLHLAVKKGRLSTVQNLSKEGADIYAKNNEQQIPLHLAAFNDNLDVLNELINLSSTSLCARDSKGRYPLHLAVLGGSLDIVKRLVELLVDVNVVDKFLQTPLHFASTNGSLSTVEVLTDAGADVNAQDMDGVIPLWLATEGKSLDKIRELKKKGANTNIRNKYGWQVLHLSSEMGNLDLVRELESLGADVYGKNYESKIPFQLATEQSVVDFFIKWKDKEREDTLLHYASREDNVDLVQLLIDSGFDLDVKNKFNWTALNVAIHFGSNKVGKLLKEKGAVEAIYSEAKYGTHAAVQNGNIEVVTEALNSDLSVINSRDNLNNTLLHYAALYARVDIIELLIGKNADVNAENYYGVTPLHLSCAGEYVGESDSLATSYLNAVRKLAPLSDVNAMDVDGNTPLGFAARKGHLSVTKELIKSNANPALQNNNQRTPFELAVSYGQQEIILYYKEYRDNRNNTLLHIATQICNTELVDSLLLQNADINVKNDKGNLPLHEAVLFTSSRSTFNHSTVVDVSNGSKNNSTVVDVGISPNSNSTQNSNSTVVSVRDGSNSKPKVICTVDSSNINSTTTAVNDIPDSTQPFHAEVNGNLTLCIAVKYMSKLASCTKVVEKLIDQGSDVDSFNFDGCSSIHLAARLGKLDVVKILVHKMTNINLKQKNSIGNTAMHEAAQNDHLSVLEFLIDKGALVDIENRQKNTPLHLAALSDHLYIVKFLLERKAETLKENKDGRTPFELAVQGGASKIIDFFTKDYRDELGNTMLHLVLVKEYFVRLLPILLDKSASVCIRNGNGDVALHLAIRQSLISQAREIMGKMGSYYVKNNNGATPLHLAVEVKISDVLIDEFVDGGININDKDKEGSTPLLIASSVGNVDAMKKLIKKGADVNAKDIYGNTPLHNAVIKNQLDAVKELIKAGANINVKNNDSKTPLDLAVNGYHVGVTLELMEASGNKFFDFIDQQIKSLCRKVSTQRSQDDIKRFSTFIQDVVKGKLKNDVLQTFSSTNIKGSVLEYLDYYVDLLSNEMKKTIKVGSGSQQTLCPTNGKSYLDMLKVFKLDLEFFYVVYKLSNKFVITNKVVYGRHNVKVMMDLSKKIDKNSRIGYYYAWSNNVDELKAFLQEANSSVNAVDKYGCTLLDWAILGSSFEVMSFLVDKGSNINLQNAFFGAKPIHFAAVKGPRNIIEFFTSKGVSVDNFDSIDLTPLFYAVSAGNLDTVEYLVGKGANINATDKDGRHLIYYAATYNDNKYVMELLLSRGLDVNKTDKDGSTPIHYASLNGNLDMVKCLADNGANINAKDNKGFSPSHLAAISGDLDIVKHLAEIGADINSSNYIHKDRVIEGAAQYNHVDIVKYLVEERGVDFNVQDVYGDRTLNDAAYFASLDVVKYLLSKGADQSLQDYSGDTPLHDAVRANAHNTIKYLVEKGANLNIRNKSGKRPVELAQDAEIKKYLEQAAEGSRYRRDIFVNDYSYLQHEAFSMDFTDQTKLAASSGIRPSSWINIVANTIVDAIKGISRFVYSPLKVELPEIPENGSDHSDTARNPTKQYTSQFSSEVCMSNNIGLMFFLLQSFLDKKYPLPKFCSITPEEALANTLNIVEEFEKTLEKTAKQSGVLVKDVNFFKVYLDIAGYVRNERYCQIPNTLYSVAKEVCPKNEKFLSNLKGNIEKMCDEQQVVNSGYQPNDIADNKPRSYLNNTTVDKQLQGSYHAISS